MRWTVVVAIAVALIAVSCGARAEVHDLTDRPVGPDVTQEGESLAVGRAEHGAVVEVVMTDFAFAPEASVFEVGETVTFLFTNRGVIAHDAVIGTEEQARQHAAEMTGSSEEAQTGSSEEAHEEEEDAAAIDLRPGATGPLVYTFTESGELVIACTWPGHLEAGMSTDITVTV
ncbi:MAG: hypothetical protein BMS9Abin07_1575 [Acidimicrobiia bacterium]|nr:MAG: hypothetical protein BMS9Abin07_1575 [Acidimicrobiia bacterium]